jgi:hypothetical protein
MKYILTERQLDLLLEKRDGWYRLLQKKLPHFPEYVLKDWIYRKVDEYKDYESFNNWINDWLVDVEWEYQKDFPISMDIFGERTKKELQERIDGMVRSDVENDVERHENQKELLKARGISQEPIILFQTKDGNYELGEGWHRTVQAFSVFPEGFIQPNVYIGLNARWFD